MIQSPELNELAAALATAQGEFDAVDKSAANPFFKSAYAPLPEVVKAATPILTKHGLSVSQLIGRDESGDTLTAMLLHKSGQYIGSTMQLRPVKQDPQAQGSAVTYARRYSYMAILGLVAEEDDDGNAGSAPARRQAAKPKPKPTPAPTEPTAIESHLVNGDTLEQLRELSAKAWPDPNQKAEKLRWMLVSLGVEDVDDLRAAMQGLTLDQAVQLYALVDAETPGDESVPGSGETA